MGRISRFPIDLRRRPYNTLALPCECVTVQIPLLSVIHGRYNVRPMVTFPVTAECCGFCSISVDMLILCVGVCVCVCVCVCGNVRMPVLATSVQEQLETGSKSTAEVPDNVTQVCVTCALRTKCSVDELVGPD